MARAWGWRFRSGWYPSWAEASASKARLAPAASSRWYCRSRCNQAWPATSPPGREAPSAICASWSSTTTPPAATTWARRSPPGTGAPKAWPRARRRCSGYARWPGVASSSMWSSPTGRCRAWTACPRCRRFGGNSRSGPSPPSSWSVPMITARSCRPPRRQRWMPCWSSPSPAPTCSTPCTRRRPHTPNPSLPVAKKAWLPRQANHCKACICCWWRTTH
ncbi:hypothetical protein D9M68_590790 [compost metagenome]